MLAFAQKVTPLDVARLIRAHRFSFANERDLQDSIAVVLERREIPFAREVKLSDRDRIDFLVGLGIGVEVKLDGQLTELMRQLWRYAASEDLTALVVVTPKIRLAQLPNVLLNKPVHAVHLVTQAF